MALLCCEVGVSKASDKFWGVLPAFEFDTTRASYGGLDAKFESPARAAKDRVLPDSALFGVGEAASGPRDELVKAVVALLGDELPTVTIFGLEEVSLVDGKVNSSTLEDLPCRTMFGLEECSSTT